jgi:heat shock protein HslJ
MKKIIFALFLAFTAVGCAKKVAVQSIANTKWTLSEWPGRTLPVNAQATLNFDSDNKIGGKSFCNSYGGNMVVNGEQIKFEQIFGTKMFCTEFSDAENKYQADLLLVNSIKLTGNKLSLLKAEEVVMVFVKGG